MTDQTLNVFIVDDDPAHIEGMLRALATATTPRFRVTTAGSLAEFRQLAAASPPQIALVDLNLPDGRAIDLLVPPAEGSVYPILVMTSFGNEATAVEALKSGAIDYLVKSPTTFALLPQIIFRVMREWGLIRKQHETHLNLERAKKDWELTFDAVPDLIAIIDNDFVIRRVNRTLATRVGLPPQELIGRRCHELFHGGSTAPHPDCPHLKMLAASCEQQTELEIPSLGGFYEVTATPLHDNGGQLLGSVHIAHDITERIRVRQQQEEYQQQLQGLARTQNILQEKERRQLATTLHDQVGQTLALTRIKLGMLHSDLQGNPLVTQAAELRSLVDEVIDATRSLTIAISPPALYQMGLGAAIESLTDSLRTTHGLDLAIIGDDAAADLAEEARIIVYQAVRELAINILKHAQVKTGEIIISRAGAKLAITVCDAGIGISSPQPGNKSFGLFNIREQLTLVRGELQIDSQVKKGTRITITVPV